MLRIRCRSLALGGLLTVPAAADAQVVLGRFGGRIQTDFGTALVCDAGVLYPDRD